MFNRHLLKFELCPYLDKFKLYKTPILLYEVHMIFLCFQYWHNKSCQGLGNLRSVLHSCLVLSRTKRDRECRPLDLILKLSSTYFCHNVNLPKLVEIGHIPSLIPTFFQNSRNQRIKPWKFSKELCWISPQKTGLLLHNFLQHLRTFWVIVRGRSSLSFLQLTLCDVINRLVFVWFTCWVGKCQLKPREKENEEERKKIY